MPFGSTQHFFIDSARVIERLPGANDLIEDAAPGLMAGSVEGFGTLFPTGGSDSRLSFISFAGDNAGVGDIACESADNSSHIPYRAIPVAAKGKAKLWR
eukprot:CAMPEP_0167776472 /NCGR_PEP_ID=MMETSP0111_2-20121227/3146_1 /TAXON_ID=91324 /ORGANISM="Lotharella globosa, Strain CCCM811" /LENGTH=98 /DNA_ID=CAMNT_0007666527 /DNA_START=866 /DNA_END=1159 /DNA_ORIENTATION=+